MPAIRRDHPFIGQGGLVDDRQGPINFLVVEWPNPGIGHLHRFRGWGRLGLAHRLRRLGRRRVMIFLEPLAAFGAEGETRGHGLLAVGAGGFRGRRQSRLRGIVKGVLILILAGHLRGGLAHLGHELSQHRGVLRQLFRAKEDKRQDGEDDQRLEVDPHSETC